MTAPYSPSSITDRAEGRAAEPRQRRRASVGRVLALSLAGGALAAACTLQAVEPPAPGPRAVGSTPRDGEGGIPLNAMISFYFDAPLDPASIGDRAIDITSGQVRQGGDIGYDPIERRLFFAVRGTYRRELAYDAVLESDRLRGLRRGLPIEPRDLTFVTSADALVARDDEAVSFREEILPILTGSCGFSGCHGPPDPVSGLDLSGAAGVAGTAVGVRTSLGWPGWPRIDSRSAAWSYLVYKAIDEETIVGDSMPPGGSLGHSALRTLVQWIDEGAKVDDVDAQP